jgi:small-conductance mechanosensitive channel
MADLAQLLDGVEQVVPEGFGEVAVTIAVVLAVIGIRRLADRLRIDDSQGPSKRNLLLSGVAAAVTVAGVILLVGVWGLLGMLGTAVDGLGLGENFGRRVVLSLVVLVGAYVISSFAKQVIEELTNRRDRISRHQREIAYRTTQVALYSLAGLLIVSILASNLRGFVLGAGFLGIIIGMAARQTLGAVLAGFVLMFSRPLEIGDWVEIGDVEGIVTHIDIFNTQIQTFEGEYVMVPNDTVSGNAIVNRTRKGRLRIDVDVGIDYDADPERAAEIAVEAMEELDEVLSVPTPLVVLKEFGDSGVILGLRAWIDTPTNRRRWRARTAMIAGVKRAFEENGVGIPFPQRELSARGAEGFSLAGRRDGGENEARAASQGGDA